MQLRKADVVAGALALLDAEGVDGLTMRKLAAQLGVQAGALYWHFPSKQALLDAMAERLVQGVGDPLPPGPWDQQLLALGERLHQALLAHRDGARVLAGTYVAEPNTVAGGRAAMEILHRAGFPADRAGWVIFALMHYVLGHTIEEQALAELPAGDWAAKLAGSGLDDTDDLRILGEAVIDADPGERFRFGLEIFLDGVRHRLPG